MRVPFSQLLDSGPSAKSWLGKLGQRDASFSNMNSSIGMKDLAMKALDRLISRTREMQSLDLQSKARMEVGRNDRCSPIVST